MSTFELPQGTLDPNTTALARHVRLSTDFPDPGTEGNVLVSQGPDVPAQWLPTGTAPPVAHVLATTTGLGAQHTTSGLTAGQVLRATGASTAAFQRLTAADIDPGAFPTGNFIFGGNTTFQGQVTMSGGATITPPLGKASLPAAIAYEDEANVFTLSQEFAGGYGALPGVGFPRRLVIGAETGTSPNAVSLAWGDNTGWKLNLGTRVAGVFTPRFSFLDTGTLDILGGANPFVRIGENTNDNVFLRWIDASDFGEIQTQIGGAASGNLFLQRSGGAVVVGTDPVGPELLRVGGGARFADAGAGVRLVRGTVDHGIFSGMTSSVFGSLSAHDVELYRGNVSRAVLSDVAFRPTLAANLTLGALLSPWGATYIGAGILQTGTAVVRLENNFAGIPAGSAGVGLELGVFGSGTLIQSYNRTASAYVRQRYDALDFAWFPNGAERMVLTNTVLDLKPGGSGVDLRIGLLGTFDSTDTPTEGQLLIYKTGSINKWQAESVQFVYNAGDTFVGLLPDNTAVMSLLSDPGTGADSPVGAPPVPVAKLVVMHKAITVLALASSGPDVFYHDGPSFPADFRYFEYEYSLDNFATPVGLTNASADKVTHGRLTPGTTYYYRVRARDRAGNVVLSSVVSAVAEDNSQLAAFGALVATEIAVDRLAALSAFIGICATGQIRDTLSNPTHAINFGGVLGIPSTVRNVINFENTAIPTGSKMIVDFFRNVIQIKDEQASPITRVELGEISTGLSDWGLLIRGSAGNPTAKLYGVDTYLQNDSAIPTQGVLVSGTLPAAWTRYFNLNGSGSMVKHDKFEINYDGSMKMKKIVVILTSGTSWTVPADFNPFMNSVEILGGGAGGASGLTNTRGGGGGGGGEYRKVISFNPGSAATIAYSIGAGGAVGANGGNTIWNSGASPNTLRANGGTGATTDLGGAGGTGGIGIDSRTGGPGGNGSVGTGNRGGGGGGGGAGPNSNGGVGSNASVGTGGAGGAGGTPDGGVGGAAGAPAANGGDGTTWEATAGAGGGGGGGSAGVGGIGGEYGAGGGGGGSTAGGALQAGVGKQGVIVITYFPIGAL